MIAPLTFEELGFTPEQVAALPGFEENDFPEPTEEEYQAQLKREAKELAAWERRNAIRAAHIAATREAEKLARTFPRGHQFQAFQLAYPLKFKEGMEGKAVATMAPAAALPTEEWISGNQARTPKAAGDTPIVDESELRGSTDHEIWQCTLCKGYHDATFDPKLHCTDSVKSKFDVDADPKSKTYGTTKEQRKRGYNAATGAPKSTTPNPIPLWNRAAELSSLKLVEYEWICDGLFPRGELTYLTGDFGSFKSYIAQITAEAVASGKELFGRETQQHPVLILDRENSSATWSKRLRLIGDLREKLPVRLLGRFTDPRAPELADPELLALCKEIHPLIIVDSFQDFHDGLNESNPDDMTKVGHWLDGLIDAGAVGVIVLHHVPKNTNGRGGKYRGSTAIIGGAGAALLVEKTSELGVSITGFKTRDGETLSVNLLFKFPPEGDEDGRMSYSVGGSAAPAKLTLRQRIEKFVESHPMGSTKRDIARHVKCGGGTAGLYGLIEAMLAEKVLALNDDSLIVLAGDGPEAPDVGF